MRSRDGFGACKQQEVLEIVRSRHKHSRIGQQLVRIQWCGAFRRFKCFFGPRGCWNKRQEEWITHIPMMLMTDRERFASYSSASLTMPLTPWLAREDWARAQVKIARGLPEMLRGAFESLLKQSSIHCSVLNRYVGEQAKSTFRMSPECNCWSPSFPAYVHTSRIPPSSQTSSGLSTTQWT